MRIGAVGLFAVVPLIGMVGLDPLTAEGRFTYGFVELTGGIPYVAAMIGFFGVAEVLVQLHSLDVKPVKQNVKKILPSWNLLAKYLPLGLRCSSIGVNRHPSTRSTAIRPTVPAPAALYFHGLIPSLRKYAQ